MQLLQSGPADRRLSPLTYWSNCCNLLHISHILLLCPSSPDLCSSLCGFHLVFLLLLQIPSCSPLTQNKVNVLRLGLTDMLALLLIFRLAFSAVSVSSSSCPCLFQPLVVTLTLAETIHVPHSPSPHHLGSTLLYNGCSLAEILPPFFPLTSPPLTLSLSGRSALHWACSVNHLSLARTLIRYGAAVDLQDNKVSCDSISIIHWRIVFCILMSPQLLTHVYFFPWQGETALFLAAIHGCYDTARLLLLHGANLELHDRRGRRAIDMAREGMHHQVLELLLAHQFQRGPVPIDSTNEMLWDERALMYSQWMGSQGLPGRSASFSGTVAHRNVSPSPQK